MKNFEMSGVAWDGFHGAPEPMTTFSSDDSDWTATAAALASDRGSAALGVIPPLRDAAQLKAFFSLLVAPASGYPAMVKHVAILTHRASQADVDAQLALVRDALERRFRVEVIICGPNKNAARACDGLRKQLIEATPAEQVAELKAAFRVNVTGGESEARLHLLLACPAQPAVADALMRQRGARLLTWEASGHDRRWLLADLAERFRAGLDTLDRFEAISDGVVASISLRGFMSEMSTHEDVVALRRELNALFPRFNDEQSVHSLSDRQLQLFRSETRKPTLVVEWNRVPLRQGLLSRLTPIVYDAHAGIVSVGIRASRTVKSTFQRAVLTVDIASLEPDEVERLIERLRAEDFGGIEPMFTRNGWKPKPPRNDAKSA